MPQAQQKQDGLGQALQIGGLAAGGIMGVAGGAGADKVLDMALKGGSVGQTAGGLASMGAKPQSEVPSVGAGRAAMSRRAEALQPMNPDQFAPQLAAAETAAQKLPPQQQAQYLPAIQKARQMNSGVA